MNGARAWGLGPETETREMNNGLHSAICCCRQLERAAESAQGSPHARVRNNLGGENRGCEMALACCPPRRAIMWTFQGHLPSFPVGTNVSSRLSRDVWATYETPVIFFWREVKW